MRLVAARFAVEVALAVAPWARRRTLLRGLERVGWSFTLRVAAYNLIRLPKLMATPA